MGGARWVTDERGFVCPRHQTSLTRTGCCLETNVTGVERFSCRGCDASDHCCDVYEFCVACCLRPEQRSLLETVLQQAKGVLYARLADSFDLCLAQCRTSARSVVHENAFRSQRRFCYGNDRPTLSDTAATAD